MYPGTGKKWLNFSQIQTLCQDLRFRAKTFWKAQNLCLGLKKAVSSKSCETLCAFVGRKPAVFRTRLMASGLANFLPTATGCSNVITAPRKKTAAKTVV
jgi:hypothetical protein